VKKEVVGLNASKNSNISQTEIDSINNIEDFQEWERLKPILKCPNIKGKSNRKQNKTYVKPKGHFVHFGAGVVSGVLYGNMQGHRFD
jgi:hypothetical protein